MPEFIQNNLNYIIWIVVAVGIVAYLVIKNSRNRKAAQSGEDLNRIRTEVGKFFPEQTGCQIAYAHWEETESHGRRVTTTYYRYAVAFQGETLWIFPLGVDKKTGAIQVGKPATLTADSLGKVNVSISEKDGAAKRVEVHLYDKNGKSIVQLYVDAENLRKTRYYPVNVYQHEVCQAFRNFIAPLAQRVSAENGALEAKMIQDAREAGGTWGIILSVVALVAGFFVAPVGLAISAVGLAIAVYSKVKGARNDKGLIVSGIVTVVMAVWTVLFFKYIV